MRSRDKALLLAHILFYFGFFPTMSCHVISCHACKLLSMKINILYSKKHPILRIAMSEIL